MWGCGGDDAPSADAASTAGTAPAPEQTSEEAVLAVVDDLIAAGATPDDEAAAEVRAQGGSERDATVRLLLPAGGEDCRVRDVVAGVPERSVRIVVGYWAPFSAVSPEEDVGLRIETADADPTSARSAPCLAAATEILGGAAEGPEEPDGAEDLRVLDSGLAADDAGVYFGAILRNDGDETLHDVRIAVDMLDASGEIVGAAAPGEAIDEIAPGDRVAYGDNASARECGCDPTRVASFEVRATPAYTRPETRPWPLVVEDVRLVRSGGRLREVRGTLVNRGEREVEAPSFGWGGGMVLQGPGGGVIAGNVASIDARGPIAPGAGVPLVVPVYGSLADLVGARARGAEVSVIG